MKKREYFEISERIDHHNSKDSIVQTDRISLIDRENVNLMNISAESYKRKPTNKLKRAPTSSVISTRSKVSIISKISLKVE